MRSGFDEIEGVISVHIKVTCALPLFMIEVVQYETQTGACPFCTWFEDLDARAAATVRVAIARIEIGIFGDVTPAGEGVSGRRIDFGSWYRVYFRAGRATARDPARGRNENAATARHRAGQGVLARLQTA